MNWVTKKKNDLLPGIVLAFFVTLSLVGDVDAQPPKKSNALAIGKILGEETLSQNGRAVIHTVRAMGDVQEQYEYLTHWVMPTHEPSLLRVGGYFTTTNPIPTGDILQAGGEIESPAMEMIRVAKRANKLDDLFRRLSEIPDENNSQQRRKVALLALVQIARAENEGASKLTERFYELISESNAKLTDRWPELLLTNITSRIPAYQSITKDIFEVLQPARDELSESTHGVHLQAIKARLDFGAFEPLKHWHPSTRATASTRGAGYPNARWFTANGNARGVVSHHVDYLHYQIPLVGNYEIEAEVSIAPYENGVVFVGGNWLSVPGPSGARRGDYRSSHGYVLFKEAKLPKPDRWSRYRTIVRENQLTTFVNGRELERREFGYAPWLALRNNPAKRGAVRNLRITGQPVIPDAVYPLLEGARSWKTYENEPQFKWRSTDDHSNGFLTGKHEDGSDNIRLESLAHYHRPIIEDGVIEYEFFYKDGEYSAHPAIERLAFMLVPDGVRLHWVNDGKHDRALDFQDRRTESKLVSQPLALKENDWNQVRLSFQGDRVRLAVNGTEVYEHKLIQSQRRIGLFYVASESALQVRNMTWSGDWPKQLPPTFQQELAGELPDCLVGLQDMQEHAQVRFNRPLDRKRFKHGDRKAETYLEPKGLLVVPNVSPGWDAYRFEADERIYGDFDAVLRFSRLTGSAEAGQADLVLRCIDEHGNRYGTGRGFRPKGEQLVSLQWMMLSESQKRTYGSIRTGDETSDGSIRLIRRNDTVYSLIAHGDSERFHLIASRKLLDPASPMMLRIEASRAKKGTLSAVLEELVVRTLPPGEKNMDPRVTTLERIAQGYGQSFIHDFSKANDSNVITVSRATANERGIELNANQAPASATLRRGASGDFDVAISLGELELGADGNLKMKLDIGDEPANVELAVQRSSEETLEIVARIQPESGEPVELGSFNLESVETLRLMRLQRTLFFVCKGKTKSRVVGFYDVGTGDVLPGSIQLALTSKSNTASAQLRSLWLRSATP